MIDPPAEIWLRANDISAQPLANALQPVDSQRQCPANQAEASAKMSLADSRVIDAAGIEKETGFVVLTIADSWRWDDVEAHLQSLEDKLNAYLEFVESSQVWETYPAARGQPVVIEIVSRFEIPEIAKQCLAKAAVIAAELGVAIRQRIFTAGEPPNSAG